MSTQGEAGSAFDPARHDSHLVALFRDQAAAEAARSAVVGAGLPADAVAVMTGGASSGGRPAMQDLFVPEDDLKDYVHALGRGCALLIVRPATVAAREAAAVALRDAGPLDLDQHAWEAQPEPVPVTTSARRINHANVSRADMWDRAVGGQDEIMLDMTGQRMTVRRMSEADMADAPFAPRLDPAQRPTLFAPSPATPAANRDRAGHAEPSAPGSFLRIVDGQTRVGWREPAPSGNPVRSYVTERPPSP